MNKIKVTRSDFIIVMLFNLAIILDSLKIIFSKRKMKHFLLCGIIIILGEFFQFFYFLINSKWKFHNHDI